MVVIRVSRWRDIRPLAPECRARDPPERHFAESELFVQLGLSLLLVVLHNFRRAYL